MKPGFLIKKVMEANAPGILKQVQRKIWFY